MTASTCVTFIDRLLHRAEIIDIAGDNNRLKRPRSAPPPNPRPAPRTSVRAKITASGLASQKFAKPTEPCEVRLPKEV